ncbi:MAG: Potassium uptake protein, integral membrane component, KtrB [uncultured Aureispira sp.]|uniref:Potassium uptake protein, integral membrane component, KtrB n=1 Tax=uncultured Aureispira sp. TaxID=1331704 RepID=A0A6S6UDX1_9BACT|nr:MAG: Potassium uptake protein, integral membrane component, KtrB [uncultured Aureispira sp.]
MIQYIIKSFKPLQLLMYGYLLILLIGFGLLSLPFCQSTPVSTIDNLFTATSALSTTGLVTVNLPESYNFGGQLVILLLIQIGGLGYMSIGSFIVLLTRSKLTNINFELINYDFSLPENFNIKYFIRDLIISTLLIELIGAVLLCLIFWQAGETNIVWNGIFHSVSAFCTAGLSLFSDSFVGYRDHFFLNFVISFLSIAGALGFIVFTDLLERFSGRKETITFTSKIIIHFTFWGILLGAGVLFLSDATIAPLAPEKRILASIFQSVAAFTTVGFNSYDISGISSGPIFFMLLLMIVGASPAGTGGGMKSTTVTALYAQLKSTFRGSKDIIYMNCKIPEHKIRLATSNFFFYVLVICIGTYLLLLVQPQDKFEVLFEAVSALGTVGLSTGLTGDLSILGKIIIMVLMFLGRIGALSFGMILFQSEHQATKIEEEDLAI